MNIKDEGVTLIRIAREVRGFIAEAPSDDAEAKSLLNDCDVVERVGRWLSTTTPIDADKILAADFVVGPSLGTATPYATPSPALCTTNGKPVAEVRANQKNETGQHDGYIVLCPDERAKGFVRPYRDSYKHVGRSICGQMVGKPLHANFALGGPRTICDDAADHEGDHGIVTRTLSQPEHADVLRTHRLGGCGSVTTMGRALSETYARQFDFYGRTFCCVCNQHFPVGPDGEFVWIEKDGSVGPRVGT